MQSDPAIMPGVMQPGRLSQAQTAQTHNKILGGLTMKKIIYLGLQNKPHEVFETAFVKNFKVVYQYENNNGKKVMLKATKDNSAYSPPCDSEQYPNNGLSMCESGKLYPVSILDRGYSGHYFELVEVV